MSLLTTIIQIRRHAEAKGDKITEKGEKDAKRLGEELKKEFLSLRVVTSPAKRALQTAQAIEEDRNKIEINDLLAIPEEFNSYLFDKAVKIMDKKGVSYTEALLYLPPNVVRSLKTKSREIIDYLISLVRPTNRTSIIVITHSGLIEPIIFTIKGAWDRSFTQRIGNLGGIGLWIGQRVCELLDGPDGSATMTTTNDRSYRILDSKLLHFY